MRRGGKFRFRRGKNGFQTNEIHRSPGQITAMVKHDKFPGAENADLRERLKVANSDGVWATFRGNMTNDNRLVALSCWIFKAHRSVIEVHLVAQHHKWEVVRVSGGCLHIDTGM